MKFSEVVNQASALLHSKGRITYGALKREFALDDEALQDLKEELIEAARVAIDENGKVLIWVGDGGTTPAPAKTPPPTTQPPASYTLPHLAKRIRAEQAALEARGNTDGEHKTITALFADLKGSAYHYLLPLLSNTDPEQLYYGT